MASQEQTKTTPRTTKIRIMFAVTPSGAWYAHGWNEATDEECREVIYDMASDESSFVFKTLYADVELPQVQEIKAEVENVE